MKFILILLLPFLVSCQSSLEDGNLNLEKVNFRTFNAKKYYAKSLKAEWSEFHKKRKKDNNPVYFFQSDVDTIGVRGNDYKVVEPYAIKYSQSGVGRSNWEENYNVCYFDVLKFEELNAVTDINNNLILLATTSEYIKPADLKKVINKLDEKYGKHNDLSVAYGFSRFKMYKWFTDDKIITFSFDGELDFKGVVLTEEEKESVKNIESDKLKSLTIFICKKEQYDDFKKMKSRSGFLVGFEKE